VKNKFHAPENWLASIPQTPFPIKEFFVCPLALAIRLAAGKELLRDPRYRANLHRMEHCRDRPTFA